MGMAKVAVASSERNLAPANVAYRMYEEYFFDEVYVALAPAPAPPYGPQYSPLGADTSTAVGVAKVTAAQAAKTKPLGPFRRGAPNFYKVRVIHAAQAENKTKN
jgi:hypothetical protein